MDDSMMNYCKELGYEINLSKFTIIRLCLIPGNSQDQYI